MQPCRTGLLPCHLILWCSQADRVFFPLSFGLCRSCSVAPGRERVSFCLVLSFPNASSQPFPLFQPVPHFATLSPGTLSLSLPPSCETSFFLITDPSPCYYSNPLLYHMSFYMRATKGPFDHRVTVCDREKCNYMVVTFVSKQNCGLTSSAFNA